MTGEGLLLLLLVVGVLTALGSKGDEKGDSAATGQYAVLVAALSALAAIHVPNPA